MPFARTLPIMLAAALAVPSASPAQLRLGAIDDVRPGNVQTPTVYVRDSGVAVEKLTLAERLERQKEWDKAADVYTEIAQKYADRVVPVAKDADGKPTQYVSAARAVQDKLAAWPAEGLAAYRRRFEDTARDLLDGGGPDAAARVMELYYATDAGRDAALATMSDAFERGDVGAAAATGRRLLDTHPGVQAERPRVLVQTGVAERLAGRDADAKTRLDELKAKYADTLVSVAGRDVKAVDALAAAIDAPVAAAVFRGDDWPTAFGAPDAGGVPEHVSAGGARLFGVELSPFTPRVQGSGLQLQARNIVENARRAGLMNGVLPSVDGGELFFQDNARVYGVSLASGLPLPGWQQTYDTARGAFALSAAGATPRGKQLAVAVTPGGVVALLGQNDSAHMQFGVPPQVPQVVCLDRTTGRRAWDVTPDRLKLPADQSGLKAGVFYGNPLVDGDTVYALLNANRGGQFDECYVVALGLVDGAYRWSSYVSSVSLGSRYFGGDPDSQFTTGNAAAVSISGGRLYVLTNLGALACLDGDTGHVRWLNLYPRPAAAAGRNRFYQPPTTESTRPFLFGPPVVSGGRVFAMPQDAASLFVCDAATGSTIAEVPKKFGGREGGEVIEPAATLVGVVGDTVVLANGKMVFKVPWRKYDPAKSIWDNNGAYKKIQIGRDEKNEQADTLYGRPFLTASDVLVPSADRVHRISLASFKTVAEYPVLPATWGDDESTGNVLATPDHLIIAGSRRVTVYADLAAATAKLDERIKADPNDTEAYARYAELLFAAGQLRPGLEKFDQAAAKIGGPDRLTPGAFRDRLFDIAMTFAVKSQKASGEAAATAEIFDRAAASARTPQQQVRYRLARAEAYRATADGPEELALVQEILANPEWRSVAVPGRASGTAGDVAEAVVAELVRQYSPTIYAGYDTAAAAQFATLQKAGTPDTAALIELAATYPSAKVSPDALTAAADAFEAAGKPREAAMPLRRLLRRDLSNDRRQLALQAVARNALKSSSQVAIARVRLKQARAIAPAAKLARPLVLPDGRTLEAATVIEAAVALEGVAGKLAADALPTFGLPPATGGRKPLQPAVAVAPAKAIVVQPKDTGRNDRVLTYGVDRRVGVVDVASGKVTPTEATAADTPVGGGFVGDTLVVVAGDGVSAVDAAGKRLWAVSLASLPGVDLAGQATSGETVAATANGPFFDGPVPFPPQRRIFVNGRRVLGGPNQIQIDNDAQPQQPERVTRFRLLGDRVVVATSTGRVAAVDLANGGLLWQNRVHESGATQLLSNDDFVVAGFVDPNNGSAVHAFDAVTGRAVYAKRYDGNTAGIGGLVNVAMSPDGVLVTMLSNRLIGIDLYEPGDREWKYDPNAKRADAPNAAVTMPFQLSNGDDQLVIAGDRLLAVYGGLAGQQSVRAYDLSTLRPVTVKKPGTDLDVEASFGSRGDVETRPMSVLAAGSMFYVAGQKSLAAWPLGDAETDAEWKTQRGAGDRKPTLDVAVCRDFAVMLSPRTVVAGNEERLNDLQLFAYSRDPVPATGGRPARAESGLLQAIVTLRDPGGIVSGAWQVADGAFFYVSGDGQLKVCRANRS